MIYECNSRDSSVNASTYMHQDGSKKEKVVGDWHRSRANLERFASDPCGAIKNRKTRKLAEYDKIYSALVFIIMVIDVRLSRSRDHTFSR